MKSAVLWALVALNVLLVAVVVNRFLPEQRAHAQVSRPSDYIMVPGELNGIATGVVFMVDTSRGELSAMSYDETQNVISPMPKIDLAQVFKAGSSVAPGGAGAGRLKPR
jgi:hypothetical protein